MTTPIPRHILVPHDFSDTAECALAYALELARRLDARVTVVHAFEVPYGFPEAAQFTADMLSTLQRAAGAALGGVVDRARRSGVAVEGVLRQGAPWNEIDEVARETEADLIVMGTHGRRGLARVLLGSVAEKVVRTAPCAVLTMRGPESAQGKDA
jgi:nucleotide-binding universal stress UspA family protein